MPYLNALSKFRDEIRTEARSTKRKFFFCYYVYIVFISFYVYLYRLLIDFKEIEILKLCDKLRDDVLPDLGVLIEDLSEFKFRLFIYSKH